MAVLLLLAGAAVLATLPRDVGALRLAGLSLLWWYAVVAAPAVAAGVTAAALFGRRPPADRGAPPAPSA